MTLIECFDVCAMENILACLYLRPERMILFGNRDCITLQLPRYAAVLAQRKIRCEMLCHPVDSMDVVAMTRAFLDLLEQDEDFVIDIAGGDVLAFFAVGAALGSLPEYKRNRVTLQRLNPLTGTAVAVEKKMILPGHPVQLTVRELVQLQGGSIYPHTAQPGKECTAADLDALWALARRDSAQWNRSISVLREFESKAGATFATHISLWGLQNSIRDFDNKLTILQNLLQDLKSCGAIRDCSRGDLLEYEYTSPLMRECTKGPGNILENKVLLEARGLRLEGKSYFHDACMGVHIDWDGIVHGVKEQVADTHNEIDVILMRGAAPLFISCKNGDIEEEEIYKLHTVANRFGAPHARKMLIATDMSHEKRLTREALIQRGRDMGIIVITQAANLTRQQWQTLLMAAMEDDGTAYDFG